MIPVQPTSIWKYLGKKKTSVREGVSHKFYLSWEDSLWDILRSYKIPENSTALVPSFFCMDVVNNMKTHGLRLVYYHLNNNLQGNEKEVINLIKLHKPELIIIFHAVGIKSKLINSEKFLRSLPSETILIEDAVHRLVNPQTVEIKRKNHFILTSLRKVVPLQGSVLFGKGEDIKKLKGAVTDDSSYIVKVIFYWLLMQSFLMIQKYFPVKPVKIFTGKIAEYFMLRGYDVIGDSYLPASCPDIFFRLYLHINFEKIENIKKNQVKFYREKLKIKAVKNITKGVSFHEINEGLLHAFPIILSKEYGDTFIDKIRNEGIFVRKELSECLWTGKYSITYLPLGPYLAKSDVNYIINTVNKVSNNSWE